MSTANSRRERCLAMSSAVFVVGAQFRLVSGGELGELVLVHQSVNVGSAPCRRGARPFGSSHSSERPNAVRSSSE
jgi:hypothetical protein